MARIQEYTAQISPNTEINTKQATGVSAGAGIENLAQGAGHLLTFVQEHNARVQATKADTLISKNNLDLETQISTQKQSFDPTAPDAAEKFLKGYDAANEAVLNGISNSKAREYAEKKIADHKAQYWNMALHNNAKLQGQELGAMVDERTLADSQAVYLNPALLETKIQDLSSFDHLPGGLGNEGHVDKLKVDIAEKLTESAVKGMIRDNPEHTLDEIKKGSFNLPGDKLNQLENLAQSRITAAKNQEIAERNRGITIQNQSWAQNHHDLFGQVDDGKVSFLDINEAVGKNIINPEQGANLSRRLKANIDNTLVENSGMVRDAQVRLTLPDGDPKKITDFQTLTAEYGHGIGQRSLVRLANTYITPKGSSNETAQGMSKLSDVAAKTLIQNSSIPWGDRVGMSLWAKSLNEIHDTYNQNLKDKSATPQEMFDPNSKKYLGNIIQKYQRSRSEMSAQTSYLLHGPGGSDLSLGTERSQPAGSDPSKTPLPVNQKAPALSPREQAALESISAKYLGGK